ncbi:phenylalanine 4-monooxygenase [Streptomyces orinoci]|uniref:Phenylalanine 4-monooxygenase n=1 Tax=Streptomyces orinoci TaxID=67339 RepID=A0ABV3K7J0_STRON|nr:phenylalanine 4-monooxygenase [Streptomyces orinoci]
MGRTWSDDRTPVSPDGRLGPARRHPGRSDPRYLRRREAIVAAARGHRLGDPSPPVVYTPAEQATWRTVCAALTAAHREHACRALLSAWAEAGIPAERIPQHREVSARLAERTGFRLTPAGGVVPNRLFLGALEHGYFHAVQFVRHPALPLYTPEPDVIHDVLGHGLHLVSPEFAELYRAVGRAANRVRTPEALDLVNRVYWFTLELGVVQEAGGIRAFGAALLSSYGELAALHRCRVRELDIRAMATARYPLTGYQPVLFAARSLDHLRDVLLPFLAEFDEDTGRRLGITAPPRVRVSGC